MFYFELDILNQSMHAWLGQWHTYQHTLGGTMVAMAHQMDYGGWSTEYGCVWYDYSQHKMLLLTSFAFWDGPHQAHPDHLELFSKLFLVQNRNNKNNQSMMVIGTNPGTGQVCTCSSGVTKSVICGSSSHRLIPLCFTEILRAFPGNVESKVSPHFRGIPTRDSLFQAMQGEWALPEASWKAHGAWGAIKPKS